jgi:hypothetical protein
MNFVLQQRPKTFWDIASGVIGAGASFGLGQISAELQEKRQKDLMELQVKNQERLNRMGHELQMETWKKTNYGAQMKELAAAGLNPSLIYGKGGAGGVTGGQGGGSASGAQAPSTPFMNIEALDFAKRAKEIQLLDAQTKNVNADTSNKEQDVRAKDFVQKIKEDYEQTIRVAMDWTWTAESARGEKEWKAWRIEKALLYGGDKDTTDTPYGDKLINEVEIIAQKLKELKVNNDILGFEKQITQLEATMAENGITKETPWYGKILIALMNKIGMTDVVKMMLGGIGKDIKNATQ